MQNIILEEPYEFIPQIDSDWWCWLVRFRLHGYLRRVYKIHAFECRGEELLRQSLEAKRAIILAPNHCRLSDPMVLGVLSKRVGTELFAMASWHLFRESAYQRWLIRRMGAFSIYREGHDRQSVNHAVEVLVAGRRPLIIFPEGAVSRHNDLLMDLMDGPGVIARQAAKRRQKEGKAPVVIHPVAIRYTFEGDVRSTVEPEVERLERSFSWQPQTHLTLAGRLAKVAEGMLALKEVEFLGGAREGDPHTRAERMIVELLTGLEDKWGVRGQEKGLVSRVKAVRGAILPDLIAKRVDPEERAARWRDLAVLYYVQQIAHYPRGYIGGENNLPERLVETVERLGEDFLDRVSYHGPMRCTMQVGEAIEVSPERDRSAHRDPAMEEAARSIQSMLDGLVAERRRDLASTAG